MKIGTDLDGVVVEFARGFLKFYNQKFGTNLKYENWRVYDFGEAFGIPREEERNLVREFQQLNLSDSLNLIEGVKESIDRLAKNNQLYVITSRPLKLKEKTEKFLKRNFSGINFQVFYSDEFNKEHSDGKAEICKRERIEVYVEDSLECAVACSEITKVFLLDKPWNQGNFENNRIIRVTNWKEVLGKLKK